MESKNNVGMSALPDYGYKATIIQFVLCMVANTALLSSGMTLGFTAVALPYMLQPNDVFHINTEEASWIASLAAIATPFGCLLSGPIIDHLGRKIGLILLNIPAFIGWILIALNPTLVQLYFGRILTGFAVGLSSIPATVYISEGATSNLRGFLATGTSIAISLGVALVYMMGLFLQERWQLVAGLCAAFPVISVLITSFIMPESPVWLLNKGKLEKATTSLMTLRGVDDQNKIQFELDEMSERTRKMQTSSSSLWSTIKYFKRPEAYKPFILLNCFFFFQQITGIFVVIFYAVDVIKEAGVTTDAFVVAVFIGLTRLVFTILAAWMSKKFGRRVCSLLSGLGMTVSLMLLATHLYNKSTSSYDHTFEHPLNSTDSLGNASQRNFTETNLNDKPSSLVPLISIMVYILTSTIGFLTIPWTMIGEVFPTKIRGVAGGLTTCVTYIISFIAIKIYPTMLEALDKHGVFYFYGAMSLLGTIFVAIFLPETQGKSLTEIEDYFTGKGHEKGKQEEKEALHSIQKVSILSSNKNERDVKK